MCGSGAPDSAGTVTEPSAALLSGNSRHWHGSGCGAVGSRLSTRWVRKCPDGVRQRPDAQIRAACAGSRKNRQRLCMDRLVKALRNHGIASAPVSSDGKMRAAPSPASRAMNHRSRGARHHATRLSLHPHAVQCRRSGIRRSSPSGGGTGQYLSHSRAQLLQKSKDSTPSSLCAMVRPMRRLLASESISP